jgi:hypothetical protein
VIQCVAIVDKNSVSAINGEYLYSKLNLTACKSIPRNARKIL